MKTGQIVEIPQESSIYKKEIPTFDSKEEELFWKVKQREYSLFEGFIVGEHKGVEQFEIGQRKGLNISGKKLPVYVIGIDEVENRVFVGQGKNHLGLFADVLHFTEKNINWLNKPIEDIVIEVQVFSSQLENEITAKFYQFKDNYFLEFNTQIPLIIKNYTIGLSYENENVLILK
ncbi:tRNA methyl transferase PRC-barrel domain-containing protein [Empedobacter brevis]|uniref:tRNA methyl transferase PRC-barrel domain-containing protein n=1 Tax=Empedobacter brevis TaxID=247 RepID=UPI0039B05443